MVQLLVCGHAPTQLAAALELARLGRCGSVNCQPAQPGLAGPNMVCDVLCVCVTMHRMHLRRALTRLPLSAAM